MEPIYIVVLIILIAFSWKLFTILRNPEITKSGKRIAISVFVFTLISLAIAVTYGGE